MDDNLDRGEGPSTRRRRVAEITEPTSSPPLKRYCTSEAHDQAPRIRLKLRFTLRPSSPPASVTCAQALGEPPPPCLSHTPRRLVGGGKPRRRDQKGSDDDFQSQAKPRNPRAQRRTRSRRQSATPTTLESIASESAAIRAEILRLGLTLRDVVADGNCLFRALGDQLWGEQGRHSEVRHMVCDYLDSAKEDLGDFVAGFLNEGETYDRYVERMRGPGVYGSHIELLAASRVFRRSIRIVLAQTSYTVDFDGPNEKAIDAAPEDGPSTRRRTRASTIDSPRPGHSMLWLALFAEAEHYESVRRHGPGAGSGPAEVPDSLAVPHARDESEAARSQRATSGDAQPPKRSAQADRYVADGRVAQVLASLPPWHEISDDEAAATLVRCNGDVSKAIDILFDRLDSDGDGDGDAVTEESDNSGDIDADAKVVDAMLYRTTSGSSVSSALSTSTAATSVISSHSHSQKSSPLTQTTPPSPAPSPKLKQPPPRITRSQAKNTKRITRSSKM